MAIIVSQKGKDAKKHNPQKFENEKELQEYITNNPEAISSFIKSDELNQKIFIVAREFETESGSIDAIGISSIGDIYIIETKLYTNSDKRKVLAQILDYGASLWKHGGTSEEFIQSISTACESKHKKSLVDLSSEIFKFDQLLQEEFIQKVADNYNNSRFNFVVLMDKVDSRLKDLILFTNTFSNFNILGVELEYYKVDDNEILIPRIWGEDVRKEIAQGQINIKGRKRWDEISFFESLKINKPKSYNNIQNLYNFVKKAGLIIDFGTGTKVGTFTCKIKSKNGFKSSLFLAPINGEIEPLSAYWELYLECKSKRKEFVNLIKEIFPNIIKNNGYEVYSKYDISNIDNVKLNKLIEIYKDIINFIQKTKLTKNLNF